MKWSVGFKINFMTLLLLALGIFGTISVATNSFNVDLIGYFQKTNPDQAAVLSRLVFSELKRAVDKSKVLAAASMEEFKNSEDKILFLRNSFLEDPTLVSLSLLETSKKPLWRLVRPESPLVSETWMQSEDANLQVPQNDDISIFLVSGQNKKSVLRMLFPVIKQGPALTHFMVLDLDAEKFSQMFTNGTSYLTFLTNNRGQILATSDNQSKPIGSTTQDFLNATDTLTSGQKEFSNSGVRSLGAYQKVGIGDLMVVSQIPLSAADLTKRALFRKTLFLSGIFFSLALILGVLLSSRLVKKVKRLKEASERVRLGDFQSRLPEKRGDELDEFSGSFNEMVQGLLERQTYKTTLEKFHDKKIVEKITKGALRTGGERLNAAVMFVDVRGFTSLSEKYDAEKMVQLLNRYLKTMVRIITVRKGVVDKYIGDAILAVWGVPQGDPDVLTNSLMACLEIRKALQVLNDKLKSEGLPLLHLGMGLHYGPVIAGIIGSDERMEYTVVGDVVNTASRVQSATKAFGTDLFVTEPFVKDTNGKFAFEKGAKINLRGKSDSVQVYQVQGYFDHLGQKVIVETPYSRFQIDDSGSGQVA